MSKELMYTKWPALLWSVIIFMLLAMPAPDIEKKPFFTITFADKIVHFFLFAVHAWLWHRYAKAFAVAKLTPFNIFLFSFLFGICMEFVQLTPIVNRDFEWGDITADGLGAAVVFFLSSNHKKSGLR